MSRERRNRRGRNGKDANEGDRLRGEWADRAVSLFLRPAKPLRSRLLGLVRQRFLGLRRAAGFLVVLALALALALAFFSGFTFTLGGEGGLTSQSSIVCLPVASL